MVGCARRLWDADEERMENFNAGVWALLFCIAGGRVATNSAWDWSCRGWRLGSCSVRAVVAGAALPAFGRALRGCCRRRAVARLSCRSRGQRRPCARFWSGPSVALLLGAQRLRWLLREPMKPLRKCLFRLPLVNGFGAWSWGLLLHSPPVRFLCQEKARQGVAALSGLV